MPELLAENWFLVLAGLLIGLAVAWWIFSANRKTTIEREDTGETVAGAKRNQALIDAPPAASRSGDLDDVAASNLARDAEEKQAADVAPGAVSAAANTDSVAAAPADADAEAGAAVPAREAIRAMDTETPPPPSAAPAETKGEDDLSRIKGVGPKLVARLGELGVTSFSQIAAWDDADIDRVDAQLGRFQGRIRRDDWVAQARYLSENDVAGYEARFGKV